MSHAPDSAPNYSVREGALEADALAVLALWEEGFEELQGDVGVRRLNWMYRDNPAGPGELLFLQDSQGRPAGFKGLGRRRFSMGGERLIAAIMADFVVGKEHRSLGPALTLLKEGLLAGRQKMAFLYGFPNRKAEVVFKRAGYRRVSALRRFARVVRSKEFLEKRLRGFWAVLLAPLVDAAHYLVDLMGFLGSSSRFHWEEEKIFDERFDGLWGRGGLLPVLTGERSSEALRWRFRDVPGRGEVKVTTATSRTDDQLAGYVVWDYESRKAFILDVYSAGDPGVLRNLLRHCSWQARKRGCQSISLEFAGPPELKKAVHRAGFLPREENPVFFVEGTTELVGPEPDLYLTSFDRD